MLRIRRRRLDDRWLAVVGWWAAVQHSGEPRGCGSAAPRPTGRVLPFRPAACSCRQL